MLNKKKLWWSLLENDLLAKTRLLREDWESRGGDTHRYREGRLTPKTEENHDRTL